MTDNRIAPLPELLRRAAERWPDRVFASFPSGESKYSEMWQAACDVASLLLSQGVRHGEHVGLLMPNSQHLMESFFGISLIGAVPVALNTRYRSDELPYIIGHAELVGIVTTAQVGRNNGGEEIDYVARLLEALPGLTGSAGRIELADMPRLRFVAAFGKRSEPWVTEWQPGASDETPEIAARREAITLEDVACLIYTSGTTSRPKGAVTEHRALVTTCIRGAVDRLGLKKDDVIWNPAPICHVSAFVSIIGTLATGAEYVTAAYFEPEMVLAHLQRRKVTVAFANFPAFYFGLGEAMRRKATQLEHLHTVTTAASPPEIERVRETFPQALQLSVTGSTELSGCACINDRNDPPAARAETAGRPLDGIEVSIRDPENGAHLPAGEIGEIWFRGIGLFRNYHGDPKSPFTGKPDSGWFRTADLGTLDRDGRLAFRGRLKDMLKVGGENVSAAEIETFLLRHPAISVAQVVAQADDRLGEVPAAFIELKPGLHASAGEIVAYCKANIAGYKVPRTIRFMTEWPTSSTKIQKDRLRAMLG